MVRISLPLQPQTQTHSCVQPLAEGMMGWIEFEGLKKRGKIDFSVASDLPSFTGTGMLYLTCDGKLHAAVVFNEHKIKVLFTTQT